MIYKGTSELNDLISKGNPYLNHKVDSESTSLPVKGDANSSADLLDPDGTVKQRRYYDTDDGTHTFPHRHIWNWSQKKPRLDSR